MTDIASILAGAKNPSPNTHGDKCDEYKSDGSRHRIGLTHRPKTTVRRLSAKRIHRQIKRESACKSQIGQLPSRDEELLMILTGDFHGWDIVNTLIDLAGCAVDHLRIATLGFNKTQAQDLADQIDAGKIRRLTMLVSELFSEANTAEYNVLAGLMADRGQTLKSNRNHCKLLLWHLSDGRCFVGHGSLNLRRCNSFEQFALSQCARTHNFFASYIDEVAN